MPPKIVGPHARVVEPQRIRRRLRVQELRVLGVGDLVLRDVVGVRDRAAARREAVGRRRVRRVARVPDRDPVDRHGRRRRRRDGERREPDEHEGGQPQARARRNEAVAEQHGRSGCAWSSPSEFCTPSPGGNRIKIGARSLQTLPVGSPEPHRPHPSTWILLCTTRLTGESVLRTVSTGRRAVAGRRRAVCELMIAQEADAIDNRRFSKRAQTTRRRTAASRGEVEAAAGAQTL